MGIPASTSARSCLQVSAINKSFSGLRDLNDINLSIEEGSVHAIIGPNGAGKSTLLNCFVGRLTPDTGTVTFDGKSLIGLKPHQINQASVARTLRTIARMANPQLKRGEIWLKQQPLHRMAAWQAARLGVGLVPEDRRIIGGLTVEESLKLARIEEPRGWIIERLYEHLPRLAERRSQEAITLSGGEQQMLAVARAVARRQLLLLDEPYEGLAPVIFQNVDLRHEYLAV